MSPNEHKTRERQVKCFVLAPYLSFTPDFILDPEVSYRFLGGNDDG